MLHCRLFEKFTFFCSLEHAFSSAYLSRTCRRLLANTDSKYSVGQRALSGRSAVGLLFTKSSQQLASCDQVSTFSAMIYSWQNREPPRHLYLLCAHPPLWILSSKPKRLQSYQRQVKAEDERWPNISECTGLGYREPFPSVRFFKGLRQVTLLYLSSAKQRLSLNRISALIINWGAF